MVGLINKYRYLKTQNVEKRPIKTFIAFLLILFSILGCSDSEADDSPSKLEEAIFNFYDVSATVYGDGTFNSSGGNRVKEGEAIRITIKPTEGWAITSVKVDGTEITDQIIVNGFYETFYSEFNFDKIIDKDYEYEISFCLMDFNICQNNFNSSSSNIEYFIEEDGFDNDVSNKNKIINFKNGFEKAQEYFGLISNIKVYMFHKQEYVEYSPIFNDFGDRLVSKLVSNNACLSEERLNYHQYTLLDWLIKDSADEWYFQNGSTVLRPEGRTRSHMVTNYNLSYCNNEAYLWVNLTSSYPSKYSPYIDEDFYFHIGVESYMDIIQTYKEYEYLEIDKINNIPDWFWLGEQEFISHYIAEKENINSVYFDRVDLDNDELRYAYPITYNTKIDLPLTNKYFIELLNKIDKFFDNNDIGDSSYSEIFRFYLQRDKNSVSLEINGPSGLPYSAFGGWALAYLFHINDYDFDLVFKEFRSNVASSDFDSAFTQTFGYSVETFLAGYYDFLENNNERSSILQFN